MTVPVRNDDAARVRALARLLDSAVRIPGTGKSIGLDAVVGLIPGIGDLAGAAMSGYIVLTAARSGVTNAVVAKMLLNLGVDTLVGTVPLLGDLFDVGYKANMRNAALLDQHLADPASTRRSSRFAVFIGVAGIVLLAAGGIAIAVLMAKGLNALVR